MAKTGHVSTAVHSHKCVNLRQNVSNVVACRKLALSDEPLQSRVKAEMSSLLSSPSSCVSSILPVSGGTFDCMPHQSGRILIHGGSGNIIINIRVTLLRDYFCMSHKVRFISCSFFCAAVYAITW